MIIIFIVSIVASHFIIWINSYKSLAIIRNVYFSFSVKCPLNIFYLLKNSLIFYNYPMMNHQELRERVKPEKIKVLFIAESPPKNDINF